MKLEAGPMLNRTSSFTIFQHVKHGSPVTARKTCVGLKVAVCVCGISLWIHSRNPLKIKLASASLSDRKQTSTLRFVEEALNIVESAALGICTISLPFV